MGYETKFSIEEAAEIQESLRANPDALISVPSRILFGLVLGMEDAGFGLDYLKQKAATKQARTIAILSVNTMLSARDRLFRFLKENNNGN